MENEEQKNKEDVVFHENKISRGKGNTTQAREKEIMKVSVVGIVANVFLAILKAYLGMISGSIAIVSDAINNITDSSSSLITIIGTRLAQRKPDREHPFGHGRLEYMTSLVIGVIVLITGAEMLINSVKNIISPTEVNYSTVVLIIMVFTIFIKILLGTYTQKKGEDLNSGALTASGIDAKNDALITGVALISALLYNFLDLSLDAYAGALISIFVIKTGLEVLRDTLKKILGERAEEGLAKSIYDMVEAEDEIISAHDLILNNYGPNTFIGSINVEIDHDERVGDIYPILHRLQMNVYKKLKIYLVFGIYAIDSNSKLSREIWNILGDFRDTNQHCLGCHGVVIDEKNKEIYFDIVLDFDCDRESVKDDITWKVQNSFPDYKVIVTVDLEFA